ncbi:MAG: exo-alpha-sialidase [Ruminococcaceae bacterium]|nr:exo-alpha-sialidase [Oscillospiraceae bacterium]
MKEIYPETEHGIVNRVTRSSFAYQGWPSVARDENGTLYAVSSSFRISHICPFGKTAMYISRDEGKTWTPPIVINDTYMDDRDAGILYMGNGKLLVTWFTHSADYYENHYRESISKRASDGERPATMGMLEGYSYLSEKEREGGSYIRISEDYGVTWGETIRVPVSAPHGPTMCSDGSLIYLGCPMYKDGKNPGARDIELYRSADGGYTWSYVSKIENPSWLGNAFFCEPHIIELPDGRLLGALRIEGVEPFSIATVFSEDGGKTWGEITHTRISGSPPHLMIHSSGALICTFGRREKPMGEQAMVSYDMGKTFSELYDLDSATDAGCSRGGDIGYPSTVELDDGSLITVYYQKYSENEKPSILYTKWSLGK